jgi:hypothetical protein
MDAGAFGLFLGRPMWCKTDEASIVGFYADVAEAPAGQAAPPAE